MRLVALVHVHDHGRHALERPRARERPRVDRAARRELPGELEHERFRARDRRRRRACPPPVPPRPPDWRPRASAGRRSRARRARPGSWRRSTLPRQSASTPSFVNDSSAATERTGVVPIAARSERAVSTAPSALVVRTTRSAARTASSFVAPSTPASSPPSSVAAAPARSASRDPITTPYPAATRRTASAMPKLPGSPDERDLHERASIAASSVVWASRRAASRSVMSVSVTTRGTSPRRRGPRPQRRSRARRAGPCNTLSHGSGSSRRRAAASSGRAGRGRRGHRSAG